MRMESDIHKIPDPQQIISQIPPIRFGYLPLRIRRILALRAYLNGEQIADILNEQERIACN